MRFTIDPQPEDTTQPIFTCQSLTVGYRGQALLPPIDWRLKAGEFWLLVGRNGAGKSTLFRTLLGLQPSLQGQIEKGDRLRLSYLPQRQSYDALIPLRARDVVAMGLERGWSFLRPWLSRDDRQAIAEALRLTDATDLTDRPFSSLSEGQKQRVLLSRAIVSHPHLLFLDEPTAAMDLRAEQAAVQLIDRLRRELNIAVVMVCHHLDVAMSFADHVLFVDSDHQAVVVGTVEAVKRDSVFRRQLLRATGELSL